MINQLYFVSFLHILYCTEPRLYQNDIHLDNQFYLPSYIYSLHFHVRTVSTHMISTLTYSLLCLGRAILCSMITTELAKGNWNILFCTVVRCNRENLHLGSLTLYHAHWPFVPQASILLQALILSVLAGRTVAAFWSKAVCTDIYSYSLGSTSCTAWLPFSFRIVLHRASARAIYIFKLVYVFDCTSSNDELSPLCPRASRRSNR